MSTLVKVIYIDLDLENFQSGFQQFMVKFGTSRSGFEHRRRMRFWAYSDLLKSNLAKGTLTKAYERQKFFLEAII